MLFQISRAYAIKTIPAVSLSEQNYGNIAGKLDNKTWYTLPGPVVEWLAASHVT